jgi:hypothetical protein
MSNDKETQPKFDFFTTGIWYTRRQQPKCPRLFFSHSDETFAHFSLAGEIGETGSLYMFG